MDEKVTYISIESDSISGSDSIILDEMWTDSKIIFRDLGERGSFIQQKWCLNCGHDVHDRLWAHWNMITGCVNWKKFEIHKKAVTGDS